MRMGDIGGIAITEQNQQKLTSFAWPLAGLSFAKGASRGHFAGGTSFDDCSDNEGLRLILIHIHSSCLQTEFELKLDGAARREKEPRLDEEGVTPSDETDID